MIRKILPTNDPRLRIPSKPVAKIDKKVLSIIRDLKDTLAAQKDPEGVGLAAPQIGKNLRIFVMRDAGETRAVINPKIIKISEPKGTNKKAGKGTLLEGCLSLPHYYGPLRRPSLVTLKFTTPEGKEMVEEFVGFTSQIVQHEIDHLDGTLFIDRLLKAKKPLFKLKKDGWEKVDLT